MNSPGLSAANRTKKYLKKSSTSHRVVRQSSRGQFFRFFVLNQTVLVYIDTVIAYFKGLEVKKF